MRTQQIVAIPKKWVNFDKKLAENHHFLGICPICGACRGHDKNRKFRNRGNRAKPTLNYRRIRYEVIRVDPDRVRIEISQKPLKMPQNARLRRPPRLKGGGLNPQNRRNN